MVPLKFSSIDSASLSPPDIRLDAKLYQEEVALAHSRVNAWRSQTRKVAELARATVPGRIRLVTVPNPSAGAPYLAAHDAFLAVPAASRYVARSRTRDYSALLLEEGMLLTPSSGRNLGPLAYVGKSLAGFAMTDIMRIQALDPGNIFYLLAFLLTETGQALIRKGRTGSNVDHLSPTDLEAIDVVWPDKVFRENLSSLLARAESLIDSARRNLASASSQFEELLGIAFPVALAEQNLIGPTAFSVELNDVPSRLDAAYYGPLATACRESVRSVHHDTLDAVADLLFLERYKRYYVDQGFGKPILSGRQLLQLRPVNLRYISTRSFNDVRRFEIRKGWSLFPCRGRSEGSLGTPAYVYSSRDGWLASEHVMRAVPRSGVHPGYLYLALASRFVQAQMNSKPTGSVVDVLDPASAAEVLMPRLPRDEARLGEIVVGAWEQISEATTLETQASRDLEERIRRGP